MPRLPQPREESRDPGTGLLHPQAQADAVVDDRRTGIDRSGDGQSVRSGRRARVCDATAGTTAPAASDNAEAQQEQPAESDEASPHLNRA